MSDSLPVFTVCGLNHKSMPLERRELFAALARDPVEELKRLSSACKLEEIALLSTCNRFEIISAGPEASKTLRDYLRERIGAELPEDCLYFYRDAEAFRHVFRVAASLDSMVLGETQILKQMKDAYRTAVAQGMAGKFLHRLFEHAFRLAKKVRESTAIGSHGISVSYVAVKLARQIFGDLKDVKALLIGSGEMAELAAMHLRSYGCSDMLIANRTVAHAEELAQKFGARAVPLTEVQQHLPNSDLLISSIRSDRPLIQYSDLKALRRARPLFLIDLGVPRNFPYAVEDLDEVFLYNIDDLAGIADENRLLREEAARDAQVIIEYGVYCFERWLERVAREPETIDFRSRVAHACREELRRALGNRVAGEELEALLPELSYRLTQKIAHFSEEAGLNGSGSEGNGSSEEELELPEPDDFGERKIT